MKKLWWEQWPGRLEAELEALDAARIPYQQNEERFGAGVLELDLQPTIAGETLSLTAVYPELFPYFRFQVFAGSLDLARHRNPFAGNLCLIGRSTWNWQTTDTLASYVLERLPALLRSARSEDRAAVAHLEEAQGEPFSDYYIYAPGSMVLVNSAWRTPPDVLAGNMDIALISHASGCLRGIVTSIRTTSGRILAEAESPVLALFDRRILARWLRVPAPLHAPDGAGLLRLIADRNAQFRAPRFASIGGAQADVIGVVFPEEHGPGIIGDGWVFVMRRGRGQREQADLVRAGRFGPEDFRARVPQLRGLGNKRVTVFGLGGIGGPGSVELARAGVGELHLLDHDHVDPGTAVRWALGLGSAGLSKVAALSSFIRKEYPFTTVRSWEHRIGDIQGPGSEQASDLEVIEAMLDGADLVFDATAEPGVHHLLCDLAFEHGLPYVMAHATAGAAGGLVARLDPHRPTGCWVCLQAALYREETISKPRFDDAGRVQPVGCGDPTFTGAGFDLGEVMLEAVRTVAGVLCAGQDGGYPDPSWDVAVLSMRDDTGGRVPPRWETFHLPSDPRCTCARE